MAIGNLGNKKSSSDIDTLKQRFNQLQSGASFAQATGSSQQPLPQQVPSQQPLPQQPPVRQSSGFQQPVPPQGFPVQQPVASRPVSGSVPPQQSSGFQQPLPQQVPSQPPVVNSQGTSSTTAMAMMAEQQNVQNLASDAPVAPGTRSPLDALQGFPGGKNISQGSSEPVNVVTVEGATNSIISEVPVVQGQAGPQGGSAANQGLELPIDETLENLQEEYDDAKLNSVIIDQVKDLIEIDNNLNSKIEDMRVDFNKEVEERKKFQKVSDERYKELKDLEGSIEKFIALYEVVTNQYNPFVKKDSSTQERFNELVTGNHLPAEKTAASEFVSKSGHKITRVSELIKALEEMSSSEFSHHVDITKNDFAVWVFHSLKDEALAKKISGLKDKDSILSVLKEHK